MRLKNIKIGKYKTTLLHSNPQFTVRKAVDINQKLTLRCYPLINNTLTEHQHEIKCKKLLEQCKKYKLIEHNSIQTIKQCFINIDTNQNSIIMVGEQFSSQSLMDFVGGFDKMQTQQLQKILLSLLQGIKYMHSFSIIHAKITPQTVKSIENQYKLTLELPLQIDMFQRRQNKALQQRFTRYTAPEIKKMQAYDGKADVWSLGIVFFELITGQSLQAIYKSNNQIKVDSYLMRKLPNNKVRTLIKGMILEDQINRLSIDEVYQQFKSINLSFYENNPFEYINYWYKQYETFQIELFITHNKFSHKNTQIKNNTIKLDNKSMHLQTSEYDVNIELNRNKNTLILYVGSKTFQFLRYYIQHHYFELNSKIKNYFTSSEDFYNQITDCEIRITSAGTIEFLLNKDICETLRQMHHKQIKPQQTHKQQIRLQYIHKQQIRLLQQTHKQQLKTESKYGNMLQLLFQAQQKQYKIQSSTDDSEYQPLRTRQPTANRQKSYIDPSIPQPPTIKYNSKRLPQQLQIQQQQIYQLISHRHHIEQIYEPLFYLGQDCITIKCFDKALKYFLKIFELLFDASESSYVCQKIITSTKIGQCCQQLLGDFKSLEYYRYALSLLVKNKEKTLQKQLELFRRYLFQKVLSICIYTNKNQEFLRWHQKLLEEDPIEIRSIMIKVYRNGYIFSEDASQLAEYRKLGEVYYLKIIDLIDANSSAYTQKELPLVLKIIIEVIDLAVSQRQKYIDKALSMLAKIYRLIRNQLKVPTIKNFFQHIKKILEKAYCSCNKTGCIGQKIQKWAQLTIPELLQSQINRSKKNYHMF